MSGKIDFKQLEQLSENEQVEKLAELSSEALSSAAQQMPILRMKLSALEQKHGLDSRSFFACPEAETKVEQDEEIHTWFILYSCFQHLSEKIS